MSDARSRAVRDDALFARIHDRAGIRFSPAHRPSIEDAARRVMGRSGIASIDEYLARVEDGRLPLADLIEGVAVGETYFFREPDQIALIEDTLVPDIVRRARTKEAPIRVWSAGCSSGEEAYSLAIVLDDLGLAARSSVLATDVSRDALARARNATYGAWSFRGDGAPRARAHVHRTSDGERFTVDARIRRAVTFQPLNVVQSGYPSPATGVCDFDLIVCRNVLIYFDPETVAAVSRRLHDALAPGGWLVTSSSDPPLHALAPLEAVPHERGIVYRRPEVPARALEAASTAVPSLALWAPELAAGRPRRAVTRPRRVLVSGEHPVIADRAAAARAASGDDVATGDAPSPAMDRVAALANQGDLAGAERAAAEGVDQRPLDAAAHYVLAAVLLAGDRGAEATASLRRAIYLDARFVIAHLALGVALHRAGDEAGAIRAFDTVARLCAAMPKDAPVPFADGACAGHIASVAAAQRALVAAHDEAAHG